MPSHKSADKASRGAYGGQVRRAKRQVRRIHDGGAERVVSRFVLILLVGTYDIEATLSLYEKESSTVPRPKYITRLDSDRDSVFKRHAYPDFMQ